MASQLPLVYHEGYNVRFFGIEKLHPFDSCKYEKIAAAVCKVCFLENYFWLFF